MWTLYNAQDFSLDRLLRHRTPSAVLFKLEGRWNSDRAATRRALEIVQAGMRAAGERLTRDVKARVITEPFRNRKGEPVTRVLAIPDEWTPEQKMGPVPKLFLPEYQEGVYPYRELCRNWPRCVNPDHPFQHPSTYPKVVQMCAACREQAGPSRLARDTLAKNNRARARRLVKA